MLATLHLAQLSEAGQLTHPVLATELQVWPT